VGKKVDLNALVVFNAVMAEQSITRAADVLAMTQPAVSNTLSRLRASLKDQLFYKDGRGIKPTAKALELWAQIEPSLSNIERAMTPPSFDAASARRRFRVAVSDIMVQLFWPPLRRIFETSAPAVDLLAFPYRIGDAQRMLSNNEIELCLGVFPSLPEHLRSTFLYRSDFVCAMRRDHPLSRGKLTLRKFAAADHLLVSLSGDPRGATDTALEHLGIRRRVAMTINSFGAAPNLLRQSDLIAVIPADLTRGVHARSSLHVVRLPVEVPPALISMAWHTRHDRDPGHVWLRRQFSSVAQTFESRTPVEFDA